MGSISVMGYLAWFVVVIKETYMFIFLFLSIQKCCMVLGEGVSLDFTMELLLLANSKLVDADCAV